MSLFKLCNWWDAQCPDITSNYDCYSMHCCRFGLYDGEKDYIVVGSHSGHLSIFKPSPPDLNPDENNEFNFSTGYKPTDVLLEIKLQNPIIDITSGTFLK